jgi:hypothetical protein
VYRVGEHRQPEPESKRKKHEECKSRASRFVGT